MGDSIQTCAVTHLPVQAGDPVVGLFLVSRKKADLDWNGTVTPGSQYKIASLPFYGEYDGSGAVDVTEPHPTQLAMGVPTNDGLEAAYLQLGKQYPGQDVVMIMVHAEVWSRLTEFRMDDQGFQGAPTADVDVIHDLLELWLTPMPEVTPEGERLYGGAMLSFRWEQEYPLSAIPAAARFVDRISLESAIDRRLRDAVVNAVATEVSDDRKSVARSILADCAHLAAADVAMMMLRRPWAPQPGVGSQHLSGLLHADIADWSAQRARIIYAEDVTVDHGEVPPQTVPTI